MGGIAEMKAEKDIMIDRIELKTAGPEAAETGLLGWISFRLNRRLQVDGVALRRTIEGRHTLSFPARRDRAGNQRFYVRPLDDETREAIESQVLTALGILAA
jgi:DNA-binding cell septation regulator SpoVG